MSGSENGPGGDSGPGRREVAHRLFATEFDASSLEYADSDEERAPKYVITPTGARVNRLFAVGVLTEVERVNDDVVRARVVDPTGAFVVYAGQYQPDALAFLERADPPAFVAVTGKANTFQPEDSDRVYTSVRPESIAEVDAETRDRWTVQAAEHTLRRVGEFARALDADGDGGFEGHGGSDSDSGRANGIALAREEYGTTPAYLSALRETAIEAVRLVAGEAEAVSAPAVEPGEDDGRAVDLADLQSVEVPDAGTEPNEPSPDEEEPTEGSKPEVTSEPVSSEPDTVDAETEPTAKAETAEAGMAGSESGEGRTDGTSGADDPDELGDFDGADGPAIEETDASPPSDDDETGAAEDDLYEFDEEERAEIESEFDMEFSSGSEVDEPGEAGIDVPDVEPDSESGFESGGDEADARIANEPEPNPEQGGSRAEPSADASDIEDGDGPEGDEGEQADVNVEDRAMDAMRDLADGDGADRESVIERVASEHGVDPVTVDDAIEDALMSGRCYEPQDGVLKPI